MKKSINILVAVGALLIGNFSYGQNQFEAMKKIGDGTYRTYEAHKKEGGYNYTYDPNSSLMVFTMENVDDIKRFQTKVKWGSLNMTFSFAQDVVGYPVTMQSGGLKHPDLQYSKRTKGDKRMVVVDDLIFYLDNYKSATDFSIVRVLKKGELSTFKKQKEVYAVLKMNSQGLEEKLLSYLKTEEAKQASEMKKWISDNPGYAIQLAKEGGEWKGKVADSDAKYAALQAKNVRIINNTSHTIYFGHANNVNHYEVESGKFISVDCELAALYKSNYRGDKLGILFKPAEYCGKSFNISNW